MDKQYNKRIKILFEVTTKINGRPKTELQELYSRWANVSALSATMQVQSMVAKLENTILFNIKYSSEVANLDSLQYKDKLFIEFRNKKYKIWLVDFHQYNHQDITLKAIEVI